MKRTLILTILLILSVTCSVAQKKASGNKPDVKLNPKPGYIMINEFTGGIGLGVTYDAFSKYYYGFTTLHGYQVNKDFLVAGGTGVQIYNEGTLVPLFIDFRYRIYVSRWTPYVYSDGGFLFDFSNETKTRLLINPGFGCSYTFSRNMAINLSTGLFTQFAQTRASYVNIKAGIIYKF